MSLDLAAAFKKQMQSMAWFCAHGYGEYLESAQAFLGNHQDLLAILNSVSGEVPDHYAGIPVMVSVFRTPEEQNQHILELFRNNPNLEKDLCNFSVLAEDCLDTALYYWNQ